MPDFQEFCIQRVTLLVDIVTIFWYWHVLVLFVTYLAHNLYFYEIVTALVPASITTGICDSHRHCMLTVVSQWVQSYRFNYKTSCIGNRLFLSAAARHDGRQISKLLRSSTKRCIPEVILSVHLMFLFELWGKGFG